MLLSQSSTFQHIATIKGDGIARPLPASLAAAVGSAGAVTGTGYAYSVAFVTAAGTTEPWSGATTPSIALTAQQANITGIPLGPTGTIARILYRNKSGGDVKDSYVVATIPDNVTTSYVDNTPDGSLGAPSNWLSSNMDVLSDGTRVIARFGDQSMAIGFSTMTGNAGYASVAIGPHNLESVTTGRRNTAVGLYGLRNVTTGYQNTAIGCHAGNGITTGTENTMLGYAAGGTAGIVGGNFNTLIGSGAGSNNITGNGNVAVGAGALVVPSTVSYNTALGTFSGKYSNANFGLWVDACTDRGSLANAQARSLIVGVGHQTVFENQTLDINAKARAGIKTTVTALGAASATDLGRRAIITDSTVAFTSANVGAAVIGGGAHTVPVVCVTTGTGSTYAWAIG